MKETNLLEEAKNDLSECISWINAANQNIHPVPMRTEDWNWILSRLKSARTLLVNLEKQEG